MNITDYAGWNAAYRHFNDRLFEGRLPEVVFTWTRKNGALGYAWPDRYAEADGGALHELAMNPDHFLRRTATETLSTLVHEMTHIEQYTLGTHSRRGYHNKAWGDLMERVGLMPSHDGRPGGKRVGQRVTHYVIEGGPFDLACQELLAKGWAIDRGLKPADPKEKRISKVRQRCPGCGLKAWAKPGAVLICGKCRREMTA